MKEEISEEEEEEKKEEKDMGKNDEKRMREK
jgi:hypothetical protein